MANNPDDSIGICVNMNKCTGKIPLICVYKACRAIVIKHIKHAVQLPVQTVGGWTGTLFDGNFIV